MAKKPEKKEKKSAGQWAMLLLLGLLAFSLIGFGATNFGGSVQSVATVDDVEVTPRQYAAALQSRIAEVSDATGQPITFAQAQQAGIDRAVLSQLIGQAAVAAEGERIGLSIPDARVASLVREIPAFQGASGFNPQVYRETLQRNGMTPTAFERAIREEEVARLLQQAVGRAASGADWARLAAAYAGERRDVTWALVSDGALSEPPAEPTEEELAAWYSENGETFRRPEEKVLTIWGLRPQDAAADFAPTEEELRAAYEARAADFRIPERRSVERLVFRTEADAAAALDRIEDGTSFDEVVADRGLRPADVDLGDVSEAQLGAAGEAVFALDGPGVAGPVDTDLGPALFRVSAILNARETPFESVRPRLTRQLAVEEARSDIDSRYGEFDDELAGGATLEDLGARAGEVRQIVYTAGDAAADTDPALLDAANAAQPGDFPELLQLEDGTLAALRVDELREARVPDLDEVRDAASDALAAERRTAALAALAGDLAARIEAGEGFEDVGLAPETAEGLQRGRTIEGAPLGFTDAVFALAEGGVSTLAAGGRVAVFRVDAIADAGDDDPEIAVMRGAVESRAAEAIARDTLDAFTRALVERSEIRIDQTAVTAVNARLP